MGAVLPHEVSAALARSRVYAALSRGFLYPAPSLLKAMRPYAGRLREALLNVPEAAVAAAAVKAVKAAARGDREREWGDLFGGQVPACPPFETEYTAAHIWMQTQQMADIAGFYRAFSVDATETGERVDALATELEFMHLLCLKEAIAEDESNEGAVAICRVAQSKFLREHLCVWLPRFVARLEKAGATGFYPALAGLATAFVQADARRFPGEGV